MIVAVVAATKDHAQRLADALGIDTRWVFGARTVAYTIQGLRADRVLIDADAEDKLSTDALASIVCTVRKTPGGMIRYVTAWIPPGLDE